MPEQLSIEINEQEAQAILAIIGEIPEKYNVGEIRKFISSKFQVKQQELALEKAEKEDVAKEATESAKPKTARK